MKWIINDDNERDECEAWCCALWVYFGLDVGWALFVHCAFVVSYGSQTRVESVRFWNTETIDAAGSTRHIGIRFLEAVLYWYTINYNARTNTKRTASTMVIIIFQRWSYKSRCLIILIDPLAWISQRSFSTRGEDGRRKVTSLLVYFKKNLAGIANISMPFSERLPVTCVLFKTLPVLRSKCFKKK